MYYIFIIVLLITVIIFQWKNNKRDGINNVKLDTETLTQRIFELENRLRFYEKEDYAEVVVPDGWRLVKRKSKEWYKNNFSDDYFPGYGKIFFRNFDVWFKYVGEKEIHNKGEFNDRGTLEYNYQLCDRYSDIEGKNIQFEKLLNSQGYIFLLSGLDKIEKKRWYFGLKSSEPTYLFTA